MTAKAYHTVRFNGWSLHGQRYAVEEDEDEDGVVKPLLGYQALQLPSQSVGE